MATSRCSPKNSQYGVPTPSSLVSFTGDLSDCFITEPAECISSIDDVFTLYGDAICEIKDDINITGLDFQCITPPSSITIKTTLQALITENCDLQTKVENLTTLLDNPLNIPIDSSKLDLSCLNGPCVPTNFNTLGELLQGIVTKLCTCCAAT